MALTASDHLEIQALISRYCITTDNADVDGFMDCWVSPDEFAGYDSGAFGKMDTWEEMRAFEAHHVGPGGMANGKRHQSANVLIEVISDSEVHVTHDLVVLEVAEVPYVLATGRYNKSLVVKTDKGWKFKRRTLDVDSGFFKLMEQIQGAGGHGH